MLQSDIDHLVVTSPSLEQGINYVFDKLGAIPRVGGEHVKMGTHNALLRLGSSTYLEVISINPGSPDPGRPRWFSLDSGSLNSQPRLATWIARTNNIEEANRTFETGNIEKMNRGEWDWLIAIPKNGNLVYEGIKPMLIQWLNKDNPANRLPDSGCSLIHINGYHQKAADIRDSLLSIGFHGNFSVTEIEKPGKPALTAKIQTPNGIVEFQ